ncbi:hypothetical protein [Escherichia coli]
MISTLSSLRKFINTQQETQDATNAVMVGYTQIIVVIMQTTTPFLDQA